MALSKYFFESKPEGQDPLGKILCALNVGLIVSLPTAVFDVIVRHRCKTFSHTLQRIGFWVIPINAICLTFVCSKFIITRVRGCDGTFNQGMAAIACMPIAQAWLKLPFTTTVTTSLWVFAVGLMVKGITEDSEPIRGCLNLRANSAVRYD